VRSPQWQPFGIWVIVALCRYIVRLEPLASLPSEDVVAAVAPSVQRYLTRSAASPPTQAPARAGAG
jgi:hypothetical protein